MSVLDALLELLSVLTIITLIVTIFLVACWFEAIFISGSTACSRLF